MELKDRPSGFPKRPYLLHSVQMAVTGDFLKKLSAISPPESLLRIFHFLVVFLIFHHAPPCNNLGALKWSLIWLMWSQNDRRWVDPAQWSIPTGHVPLPFVNSRLALYSLRIYGFSLRIFLWATRDLARVLRPYGHKVCKLK